MWISGQITNVESHYSVQFDKGKIINQSFSFCLIPKFLAPIHCVRYSFFTQLPYLLRK